MAIIGRRMRAFRYPSRYARTFSFGFSRTKLVAWSSSRLMLRVRLDAAERCSSVLQAGFQVFLLNDIHYLRSIQFPPGICSQLQQRHDCHGLLPVVVDVGGEGKGAAVATVSCRKQCSGSMVDDAVLDHT